MKKILFPLCVIANVLDFVTTLVASKRFGGHFREHNPIARIVIGRGNWKRFACIKGAVMLLAMGFCGRSMRGGGSNEDDRKTTRLFAAATLVLLGAVALNTGALVKHWRHLDE